MLEKEVEKYLESEIKKMGGICLKFISPSLRGVPDRLIGYFGKVYFVEVIRPGEKSRPLQVVVQNKLRRHGLNVTVVDSKESVDELCRRMFEERVDGS